MRVIPVRFSVLTKALHNAGYPFLPNRPLASEQLRTRTGSDLTYMTSAQGALVNEGCG